MSAALSLDLSDALTFSQQLQVLQLPAAKRQKLLRKQGMLLRKQARTRISQQTDVEGHAFAPRKPHRKKRPKKMLRNIAKAKWLKVTADSDQVRVGYSNPVVGRVASEQQEGVKQEWNAARMKEADPSRATWWDDPATKEQAIALRAAGFKRRIAGKKLRPVSVKWIEKNLSKGQAGIILRALRADAGKAPGWTTETPPRAFLGASQQPDKEQLIAELWDALGIH